VRLKIIRTARRHFFAHGFRGVTMDDLAREMGISKKTFYAHFENKKALVQAVVLDKLQDANADLDRLTTSEQDFFAMIHDLLVRLQYHLGEIQPPFVRDINRDMPELFQMVQERRKEMIQRQFRKVFAMGRKQGGIRKDIDPELIIEILVGAANALANPAKVQELGITPKQALSTVITIVLEGALTRKGKDSS
jgi:AcrR family transcriptional regulator